MKKKKIVIIAFGVLIIGLFFFFKSSTQKAITNTPLESSFKKAQSKISNHSKLDNLQSESSTVTQTEASGGEVKNTILITADNFEKLSNDCFQGATCAISGDPWSHYVTLKNERENQVADLYIAFLRKQLNNPKFKNQYKDLVLKMIRDFYPREQMDFQIAAYYNYLGDLESSLKVYLDLEKKAKSDPKIFSAPKLNIANTYFDLKRYDKALVYYQSAVTELKSIQTNDSLEVIAFINERIDFCKDQIQNQ